MSTSCVHHWIIQSAKGETSLGYCQKCFRVKEFCNFTSEPNWSNQQLPNQHIEEHKTTSNSSDTNTSRQATRQVIRKLRHDSIVSSLAYEDRLKMN
jgi:hypothetical protein